MGCGIDSFADMTDAVLYVMIVQTDCDRDITLCALGYMATLTANEPTCISFFVVDDQDFFLLSDIRCQSLCQCIRKKVRRFLIHIDETNFFVRMGIESIRHDNLMKMIGFG